MNLLLSLMKSKMAAAGAVVLIAVMVILLGPRFYLVRPWNFVVGGAIILGWLLWMGYQKLQAKKNASALEGFLRQQADDQLLTARPDVKDEIAALKEKMERAIRVLKQSKLGKGRRGADALYVLPWYMIIGPSACGKSTAIRNSGLNFPPIDPDSDSPGAIKGLGGTRNCDWWFTNEGIVLDTAGRYTISIDAAEDREEWSAFLGLLKKFRKRNPINGLLVMVSVDELMQQTEDGIESHAKNVRQRIDELMVKLEIIFPVYLVFTKCDLVSGFVEFFGDMSKREREQVWGYTIKYDLERAAPAHEEFRRQTETLFESLAARRARKLAGDLRPGDEKHVYLFPLEFAAACRKLTSFMETLLQANPFQQNPALRGVYFTSGTQEGTPIGQVMASMAKEFSIQEDIAALLEPPKETKAYFIKDLFTQIIMADQAAARPTASSAKRRKWIRLALAGGIAVATVLLVLAFLNSYFGNRGLMASTQQSTQTLQRIQAEGGATLIADLEVMNGVRQRLDVLDDHNENGPPLNLRWGLYKGETVNRAARQVLLKQITDLLMAPTARKFEQYLQKAMASNLGVSDQRISQVGTAYLMLTEQPEKAPKDVGALAGQTDSVWTAGSESDVIWREDFVRLAGPLVRFWWRHRADPGMAPLVLAKDRALSERIYTYIREHFSVPDYYNQLIGSVSASLRPFTVEGAAPGTALLEGRPVDGAYTKIGWDSVRVVIEKSREEIERDPFIREALAGSMKDIEKQLLGLYVANYKMAWADFFDGIRVASFGTIADAVEGLDELGKKDSPLIELLKKAADNSEIEWKGDRVPEIYNEFSGINEFLGRTGLAGAVAGESDYMKNYLGFLASAKTRLDDSQGAFDAFENCGKGFGDLSRGIERDRVSAERLLVAGNSPLSRKASEFLGKPISAARGAGYASACNCLNEAWKAMVSELFDKDLGGKYPFNAYGPDASMGAVVEFFSGSASGIGKFDEQEARRAAQAGISLSGEYQQALQAAERIREVIAGNALNVSFTLTARSPQFRNAEEATLTLGGRAYKYNMGGERRYEIAWGALGSGECVLSIIPSEGAQPPPMRESGDWGFFRLLEKAQIRGNVIYWTPPGSNTTAGYELTGPAAAFIQNKHFAAFKCPARACGGE